MPGMWQRVALNEQRELMPAVRYGELGQQKKWLNAYAVPLGNRMSRRLREHHGAHARGTEIRNLNRELERSSASAQRRYRTIFNAAPVACGRPTSPMSKHGSMPWRPAPPTLRCSCARPTLAIEAAPLWHVARAQTRPLCAWSVRPVAKTSELARRDHALGFCNLVGAIS